MNNKGKYYTFISHNEYNKKPKEEIYTKYYQIASYQHPKTAKYHIIKYIINDDIQIADISEYMLTKKQLKQLYKSIKIHEYKSYPVYTLNNTPSPHYSDLLASRSSILNNRYNYTGYAPF